MTDNDHEKLGLQHRTKEALAILRDWDKRLQDYKPGLYLISRPSLSQKKKRFGIPNVPYRHYAILDIGHTLRVRARAGDGPVLVDLARERVETLDSKSSIDVQSFAGDILLQGWNELTLVDDVDGARERFDAVAADGRYHLLSRNCEHFARYICFGEAHSRQVLENLLGRILSGNPGQPVAAPKKSKRKRQSVRDKKPAREQPTQEQPGQKEKKKIKLWPTREKKMRKPRVRKEKKPKEPPVREKKVKVRPIREKKKIKLWSGWKRSGK